MISMAEVARELYLRIDQEKDAGIPALTKSGALELVRGTFDIISQAALAGESIMIPKFGKFSTVLKPARKARNPRSGEEVDVPERLSVKFRPSSGFRMQLLEAKPPEKEEEKKPKKVVKKESGKKKKKKK